MQIERVLILVLFVVMAVHVWLTKRFSDEVAEYCKANNEKLKDLYEDHERLCKSHQREICRRVFPEWKPKDFKVKDGK